MTSKTIRIKPHSFLAATKPLPSQHARAARARWNVQRRLDLETAHAVFAHVDGGMFKAFIDRLQLSVLRAHEPLSMESLAIAVRILGNIRVDRFKLVDRSCGLARIISLFMSTLSRAQLQGLKSELSRHFEASREALNQFAAQSGTGRQSCRRLFVDLTLMQTDGLGLIPDRTPNAAQRGVGLMRVTMLKGDNHLSHACIRIKDTEQTDVKTEADVFACARMHGLSQHPEGLFICDPAQTGAQDKAPELPLTLRALDPIEATAAFIVEAARAYRCGSPVAVTIADSTGRIDPVKLKQAILRHPIKTTLAFAYLPCAYQASNRS